MYGQEPRQERCWHSPLAIKSLICLAQIKEVPPAPRISCHNLSRGTHDYAISSYGRAQPSACTPREQAAGTERGTQLGGNVICTKSTVKGNLNGGGGMLETQLRSVWKQVCPLAQDSSHQDRVLEAKFESQSKIALTQAKSLCKVETERADRTGTTHWKQATRFTVNLGLKEG